MPKKSHKLKRKFIKRKVKFSRNRILIFALIFAVIGTSAVAISLVAQPQGKGNPNSGAGKPNSGTSSLSLVLLDSTDGLAHYGQRVTFEVATTATTEPLVDLGCYQNGTLVLLGFAGFSSTDPWPWTKIMTLSTSAWTGGEADCTARLYSASNTGKTTTLATLNFHVYP